MSEPQAARTLRILHLEDDANDAELVRAQLEGEGFRCDVVRVDTVDGFAANLDPERVDIVLSDYSMPSFNGVAALTMARERCPEVPFLFVSGTIGEERAIEAMQMGATDYVLKQRLARLGPAVRRALVERAERQARHRAEEAVRHQQAFLRQVIDISPSFMFAKDRLGRFTLVNQAVAEAYGGTVEGLLGKTDADFNPNPEEVEAFRRDDLAVMDTGQEKVVAEEQITDAAGQRRWLYTVKRPLRGPDGKADQILGVATDITARKEAEDQLRQAQKMEAIGQLAGGVAHDFNNLLGVIVGYADLLLKDLGRQHPAARRLEQIHKATERATALTRQLLAFSRKQILQPRVLDLNTVIVEVEKMLARLIGEAIQVLTVPAAGLGHVKADPGQLEQVIVNLAVNARDAMPRGGKLIIETANVSLDETFRRLHRGAPVGPHVVLAVSDTGSGIDAQTLPRIFEPFFTTKEKGKGTGLGLSTVYGIVKQSGGYVTVYSEPGRGTTFKVYLPRVDEPLDQAAATPPSPEPPVAWETVLLVEDEGALRSMIQEILQEAGYTVLPAATSDAALDAVRSHPGPVHVMVTDVVLPRMGGRELAEQVAALRPSLRVLYMSGYTDEAIVHHGMLDPGMHFLQKPFTADDFLRRIRELLGAPSGAPPTA
jgi:PAS domain S-box-containing protein